MNIEIMLNPQTLDEAKRYMDTGGIELVSIIDLDIRDFDLESLDDKETEIGQAVSGVIADNVERIVQEIMTEAILLESKKAEFGYADDESVRENLRLGGYVDHYSDRVFNAAINGIEAIARNRILSEESNRLLETVSGIKIDSDLSCNLGYAILDFVAEITVSVLTHETYDLDKTDYNDV